MGASRSRAGSGREIAVHVGGQAQGVLTKRGQGAPRASPGRRMHLARTIGPHRTLDAGDALELRSVDEDASFC